MSYSGLTPEDRAAMLAALGVPSFEALVAGVPASVRARKLDLPEPLDELSLAREIRAAAAANESTETHLSFLGAGAYEHYIPPVVRYVVGRGEFSTAYTPYQPEASQGTLQAIFEYQSLMCELTGLSVSNASHYDGATSLAEACLLALRANGRRRVLASETVHPEYRQVAATYLGTEGFSLAALPVGSGCRLDRQALAAALDERVAAVVVQSPNFFGCVEDLEGVAEAAHRAGALAILVAHPMAYGIFRSAGEWGMDIAVGDVQPLGLPLSFGGPYAGYFITTRDLMRRIPGRLVGVSEDRQGRRAFTLTLQAREQHIRRERASSNICTNQSLCVVAACAYLAYVGPQGLATVARLNVEAAGALAERLAAVRGCEVVSSPPVFNEFVLRTPVPAEELSRRMLRHRIFAGVPLARFFPNRERELLVCATEVKSQEDLDQFAQALERELDSP